jgi:hypothetical protein
MRPNLSLRLLATLALVSASSTAACGDDGTDPTPDPDAADTDISDVGSDTVADAPSDVADDAGSGDATGEDTDVADVEVGAPCGDTTECEQPEFCVEGFCQRIACQNPSAWGYCQTQLNAVEDDLGRFAVCLDHTCQLRCVTDLDCGSGEICTDFGVCRDFGSEFGPRAGGGERAPLQVGFSDYLWNFPVGIELGGYGERAASDDGRYAVSLRASVGTFHGLTIRVAALDNGENELLIIRLPIIFIGGALQEDLARNLLAETGEDYRDSILISSTHTHSGPCRHWHLPDPAAAPLGAFGIGEYGQWFYDWLLEGLTAASLEAIAAREPASFGWTIVEAFDTEDSIGSDRWSETPPFDDNRLLLMRIDNADGEPMGVMFSFAAHGTDNGSDYASGDVLEGAERALNMELSERYGRFIPTMFLNQNSGNMSPRGDAGGHDFPQTVERLGWRLTQKAIGPLMEIETSTDIDLDTYIHRFPINYDLLGYERGEFGNDNISPPFGGEYRFGGLSCAGSFGGDENYETHDLVTNLICGGALQFLMYNQPPTTMTKSQIMVGNIGGLTFVTGPGELANELSWEMLREIRDLTADGDAPVDPLNSWTFGYVNDHLLYILPTNLRGERPPFPGLSLPHPSNMARNPDGTPVLPGAPDDYPDFAFSYLQGGYESGMSPWGPNLGDYLVDRTREAWMRFEDPEAVIEIETVLPNHFSSRGDAPYELDATDPADIEITENVPAEVARLEPIEFRWIGGDPGAEAPQVPLVTLERFNDETDTFEPVVLPNTKVYTNREWLFMTRVRNRDDNWEWTARWEELETFPLGRYQFRINGHYLAASGEEAEYELVTNEFELTPVDISVVLFAQDGDNVTLRMHYPTGQNMRFFDEALDPGSVSGHFRMRHPNVPTTSGAPVEIDEDFEAGDYSVLVTNGAGIWDVGATPARVTTTALDGRNMPASFIDVDLGELLGGTYTIEVSIADNYGNTGSADIEVTVP